jgi:hypothetical protein
VGQSFQSFFDVHAADFMLGRLACQGWDSLCFHGLAKPLSIRAEPAW